MKLCEKSPARDKNLPLKPIVGTRQISRPPVMHAAIPIGDLYFRAFLGLSRTTTRDAHRRTGGELVAANVFVKSRGRSLDWLRLLQIT
jgi:hypothetical protein